MVETAIELSEHPYETRYDTEKLGEPMPNIYIPPPVAVWKIAHDVGADSRDIITVLNHFFPDEYGDPDDMVDAILAQTIVALASVGDNDGSSGETVHIHGSG